jgi:predicted nucleotidyltransferase
MEERREKALAAAKACAELLKTRFGAKRVIIFGSLVGHGPWHDRSDIDLAVEGLAPADYFRALSACYELLPRGMELDLVPMEDAYPEMRARILGEVEMPKEPIPALKGLIEDELTALKRVAQEMDDLLSVCAQPPTRVELRAMASMLHEFYNGIERIFERIAIYLGEDMPRGDYWHVHLLNRMAEEQEGIRPTVIEGRLRDRLEEYLKFRHFFRHAYGYTLEWVKIRPLAEMMAGTLEELKAQLAAFLKGLAK